MLKNYFKLAIKVLGRRKFFTFISLFGISFTLMILMIATAFFESELGTNAPMTKRDQLVFAPMVTLSKEYQDTTLVIDTSYIDNVANYDTTYNYKPAGKSMSRSSLSYHFIKTYLTDIPFVDRMSIFSGNNSYDIFINGKKLNFSAVFTDEDFWNIYDFHFLKGDHYKKTEVDNQEQVVVISKKASLNYFGTIDQIIGKEIVLDGKHFKVGGIIESGIASMDEVNADVYIPLTHKDPIELKDQDYLGGFNAIFLGSTAENALKIKNEINLKEKKIPLPDGGKNYNIINIEVMTFFESYATGIVPSEKPEDNLKILFSVTSFFLVLFFLLPTLNLINLNVSRIMERSSEIGVRKAFGANSQTILFQFVFENIILTLIGGLIGFTLALIIIYVINDSQILKDTILSFNYKVFIYSFLICLFFGILSGLIPAWRMSRVHIVDALKQNQL
jgi:putative ABC transport system permease protein